MIRFYLGQYWKKNIDADKVRFKGKKVRLNQMLVDIIRQPFLGWTLGETVVEAV